MSVGCTEAWDHEFVTSKGTHTQRKSWASLEAVWVALTVF